MPDYDQLLNSFLNNWGMTASLVLVALLVAYIFRLKDPRHMEREVARKREKERVADAINKALHDLYTSEQISADGYIRWGKRLGRDFDLPDLIAVKKVSSKWQMDTHGLKLRIVQRLSKMGAGAQAKLAAIRSRKPHRKPKLIIPKLP